MKRILDGSKQLGLAIAAIALATMAGLGVAQAAEKELVIGQNDALSGGGAVFGIPQQRAVQMAVAEINAKGGIKAGADNYKIKVVTYDDKNNPTEATNSVRKMIDRDGVKYLVGFCCSGPTMAVASFIGREDVVMLVGTAADRSITTQGLPNLFRARVPADYTGQPAGEFVAARGVKTLAVLGTLDISLYQQFLEALERGFTKGGGKIVAKESFGTGDRDMSPQLTKIRALNPDAIFAMAYIEQSAFVYRQALELGLKMPRYGITGGNESQFLKVVGSDQMEGVWDLRPVELTLQLLGPTAVEFVKNYKARYNEEPTPNAPYTYDLIYALKSAIEKVGSVDSPKKVAEALHQIAPPPEAVLKYIPIDGHMFDENGQAYIGNAAFQWQKGKWHFVSELPSDAVAYSKHLRSLRK